MRIYVLTARRPERQVTSDALCAAGIEHVVVEDQGDGIPHNDHRFVETLQESDGIRGKRNYVLETTPDPMVLMLDDDLTFRRRTSSGSFVKAIPQDLRHLMRDLEDALRDHAHVGVIDEFMSHTQPRGLKHRGRYNQVLGYNLGVIPRF